MRSKNDHNKGSQHSCPKHRCSKMAIWVKYVYKVTFKKHFPKLYTNIKAYVCIICTNCKNGDTYFICLFQTYVPHLTVHLYAL